MNNNRRVRQLRSWERADHKFAIATLILFAFFLVGGVAAWLTGETPTAVAERSPAPVSAPQ